jgi:hypothetical protein
MLNLLLNATSALWANDSVNFLLTRFTQKFPKYANSIKDLAGLKTGAGNWLLHEKGRCLGLVVEERVYSGLVEDSLRLCFPNSTGNCKLDKRETGVTEVCLSLLDLAGLNIFLGHRIVGAGDYNLLC